MLESTIEKEGYVIRRPVILESGMNPKVQVNETASGDSYSLTQWIGIGILLLAVYVIIKNTIGFNYIPELTGSMGYGLLFVVGVLTSLHCVAMCGGISLSQCVDSKATVNGKALGNRWQTLRPSLLYNFGRVISYTVIGGAAGALGVAFSFTGAMKGAVAILAGVFMVLMGLRMLGLAPWASRFIPKMPRFAAEKLYKNSKGRSPFYVGLLNGFMPCGPLQSMQLYALGTGSFFAGAFSMMAFSLGTVPLMFGFGAFSSLLGRRFTKRLLKLSAVLVVMLGVVMMGRGFSLSGITLAGTSENVKEVAAQGSVAVVKGDVQEVVIALEPNYYEPIVVQKGIKVRFNIQAASETLNGCNSAIQIPEYGVQMPLNVGDNWIEFTPDQSGSFVYSCWMGMIKSRVIVVDDLSTILSGDVVAPVAETTAYTPAACCQ
jgi:sulfite exporter TauE/SafE